LLILSECTCTPNSKSLALLVLDIVEDMPHFLRVISPRPCSFGKLFADFWGIDQIKLKPNLSLGLLVLEIHLRVAKVFKGHMI